MIYHHKKINTLVRSQKKMKQKRASSTEELKDVKVEDQQQNRYLWPVDSTHI